MAISQQRILRNLEEKYATGELHPNQLDGTGLTLLHKFAFDGHLTCFKWLLRHGADPLVRSGEGSVSAHYAAASGHLQILQCLHEAHPDCLDLKDSHGTSALYIAAQEGQLDCLIWLAKNSGLLGSEPANDGMTAVHAAAQEGHLDCVRYLVQFSHCSALQKDSAGCIPLHFAAAEGHWKVVKWLIEHGGVTGEEQDKTGSTPLHLAAECGKLRVIKVMLKLGVSPLLKDADGKIPVEVARDFGHNGCISFFIQFMTQNKKPLSAQELSMGLKKVRFNEKSTISSQTSSLSASSYVNWTDISKTKIHDFLGHKKAKTTSFPWEDSMDLEFDLDSLNSSSSKGKGPNTPTKRNNTLRSKKSARPSAYLNEGFANYRTLPMERDRQNQAKKSQNPEMKVGTSEPMLNINDFIPDDQTQSSLSARQITPDILLNLALNGQDSLLLPESVKRRLPPMNIGSTSELPGPSKSRAIEDGGAAQVNRVATRLPILERVDSAEILSSSMIPSSKNGKNKSSSMAELNSSAGVIVHPQKTSRSHNFLREKDSHPQKQIKLPVGYKGIVQESRPLSHTGLRQEVDPTNRSAQTAPLRMTPEQSRSVLTNKLSRYSQFYGKDSSPRKEFEEENVVRHLPLPHHSGRYGDNIEEAVTFFSYNLRPKKRKGSKAWSTIKHNLSNFFNSLRSKRRGKTYSSDSSFWTDFDGSYRFTNEAFSHAHTVAETSRKGVKKTSLNVLFPNSNVKAGDEHGDASNGVRRTSQLQPGYSAPDLSHIRSMALDKSLRGRQAGSLTFENQETRTPESALEKFVSRKEGTGFELGALKLNLADNPRETGNALIW